MIILDPIDGTKEFVKGIPECAVSLAILNSPEINDSKNFAWIYNPFNHFEISSNHLPLQKKLKKCIDSFVSKTEWNENLYQTEFFNQFNIIPKGSIAYKLGLLANFQCDFIITQRPKHIWDIAAGTILCHRQGFKFYEDNCELVKLDQLKLRANLIWCRPEHFSIFSYLNQ